MKGTVGNSLQLLGHILILLGGGYLLAGQVRAPSTTPHGSQPAQGPRGALEPGNHSPTLTASGRLKALPSGVGYTPTMLSGAAVANLSELMDHW